MNLVHHPPPPVTTATLRLDGVRLGLAGFTLEIDVSIRSRVAAIFGPSGSGKTSLLEIVAGLRRPRQGRVQLGERVFCDSAIGVWVPPEARRVGYVPQEGALFPHLSLRENLLYGHRPAPRPGMSGKTSSFTLETVAAVLEIGHLLDRPGVGELSGGERQRVALGRALLAGPELLLLDEPLAGLDAELKARVLPYLARVRDEFGVPMLFVSHAPAEIMALCDEALILERGRVVAQGPPGELFEPSAEPVFVRRRRATPGL